MNPRNDPVLLAQCVDDECHGPDWWGCGTRRGCYEQAKRNYGDSRERPRWETDQSGHYDMNPKGGTLKPGS